MALLKLKSYVRNENENQYEIMLEKSAVQDEYFVSSLNSAHEFKVHLTTDNYHEAVAFFKKAVMINL